MPGLVAAACRIAAAGFRLADPAVGAATLTSVTIILAASDERATLQKALQKARIVRNILLLDALALAVPGLAAQAPAPCGPPALPSGASSAMAAASRPGSPRPQPLSAILPRIWRAGQRQRMADEHLVMV
jgi:hypothetical protein